MSCELFTDTSAAHHVAAFCSSPFCPVSSWCNLSTFIKVVHIERNSCKGKNYCNKPCFSKTDYCIKILLNIIGTFDIMI